MKIRQSVRHFAARKALELPGVRTAAKKGLVSLHTRIFLQRADEDRREERRDHLDGLFDATMDMYLAALQAGHTEASAREITHIVANFDFYNHGWTEMMEIPANELDTHYERYRDFFEAHRVAIDDPLGTFEPPTGLPDAPSTPERLDEPSYEYAEAGYEDDVYVQGPEGDVVQGGREPPEDVDPDKAPGTGN